MTSFRPTIGKENKASAAAQQTDRLPPAARLRASVDLPGLPESEKTMDLGSAG